MKLYTNTSVIVGFAALLSLASKPTPQCILPPQVHQMAPMHVHREAPEHFDPATGTQKRARAAALLLALARGLKD